jgi:hypothetical protein
MNIHIGLALAQTISESEKMGVLGIEWMISLGWDWTWTGHGLGLGLGLGPELGSGLVHHITSGYTDKSMH